MKTVFFLLAAMAFSFSAWAAGDADLPLAAKNVISTMERKVADIRKKAVADLKNIMKKEAQAGRIEKVTLLNNIIKGLEEEIERPAIEKSNAKYDDKIIGLWKMPVVQYEINFKNGHRFAGKFGADVKWEGTWEVKEGKLIVKHPFDGAFDTYDLPPKREMAGGRTVYKIYGHTEKGEGRVLMKAD